MLRILIVGVLLLRLTPLGGETVESVFALIAAVDGEHGHDVAPDPEHGCTAVVHHCSCHSVVADVHAIVLAGPVLRTMLPTEHTLESPTLEPDRARLLRPPTA